MIRIGMPFDLDSMLSSSPPGFELNLDIRSDFAKSDDERKKLQLATKARWYTLDRTEDEAPNANICGLDEEALRRISSWESYYSCDQSILDSAAEEPAVGLSRKVSFADRLESVLVIEESPDDPPWTLCRDTVDAESGDDAVIDEPRLAVNFTQPAAGYLAFRNAVETRFVSLANVIVKSYRVSGTVRVKNVAYDKLVAVRHSFDGWATHADAAATHQADDDRRFDTFAFVIDCPPNYPPGTKLEFAVRYTAGGVDYWDSNRGENYQLLYVSGNSSENYWQYHQHPAAFSGQPNYVWSEYSGWSDIDDASPYW